MANVPDNVTSLLLKREKEGTLRSLSISNHLIDFSSNDYLGIATNNLLSHSQSKWTGSTGSRLISGNSLGAEETENFLAETFGYEAALIFNSGYDANVGLFSSIAHRNDVIIYDELIHASVKDGCRLSQSKSFSFKHNSIPDLERKLVASSGQAIVVVESIYSMDGDKAPLKELVEVCEKHSAFLIVDEAHALGVTHNRLGIVHELNLQNRVCASVITFGKAAGCHGAAVVGSNMLRNFLINFSRSFIYTTALPAISFEHISNAVKIICREKMLQEKLETNIKLFKQYLSSELVIKVKDCVGPIQSIIVPGNDNVKRISQKLAEKGFNIKAILSPTVPSGLERIRICIHAFNKEEDIKKLCAALNSEI